MVELMCEQWSSKKNLGLEGVESINLYFGDGRGERGDVKLVPGGTMFWKGM